MFEARMDAIFFKKLVEALCGLVTEVNIACDGNGIGFSAMDASHVSFIEMILSYSRFDYYRCDDNIVIGLDLKRLSTCLSCAVESDEVMMSLDPQDEGTVEFKVLNKHSNTANQVTVSMRLLSLDQDVMKNNNERQYACEIEMESKEFKAIVDTFKNSFELVQFEAQPVGKSENPKTKTEFTESDKTAFTISSSNSSNVTYLEKVYTQSVDSRSQKFHCRATEPVKEVYEYRYLKLFAKLAPLLPRVRLEISPNMPMLVAYRVTDERDIEDLGHVNFFLAPRAKETNEEDTDNNEDAENCIQTEHLVPSSSKKKTAQRADLFNDELTGEMNFCRKKTKNN